MDFAPFILYGLIMKIYFTQVSTNETKYDIQMKYTQWKESDLPDIFAL